MNEWHKLAVVVKQTGIPYQSLARYIKRHTVHLQLKQEHKTYLLHTDSIPTVQQIRKHYERGLTESEVEKELSMSGIPVVIEMEENQENELGTLGNILLEMKQSMASMNEKLEKQELFNQELLKKLNSQQAYIEQLEEKQAIETKPEPEVPKKKWWELWK